MFPHPLTKDEMRRGGLASGESRRQQGKERRALERCYFVDDPPAERSRRMLNMLGNLMARAWHVGDYAKAQQILGRMIVWQRLRISECLSRIN
jgi:hypothetical protein